MTSGLALAATGLGKRYGKVVALDGVDLSLAPGELVGLLGQLGKGLGPLGGAEPASPALWAWTFLYLALVGFGAALAFGRRDL